jgi:GxxExxY protein
MPDEKYVDLTSSVIAAYHTVFYATKHHQAYTVFNLAEAMNIELQMRGHRVEREVGVLRTYQRQPIGPAYVDIIVDRLVAIVVKKNAKLTTVHDAQLRAYLDDSDCPLGLLINFGGQEPEVRQFDRREESE